MLNAFVVQHGNEKGLGQVLGIMMRVSAPPEKAMDLQRRIAGSQLVVIEDAGHMLTNEQPAAFNRALEEFVRVLPR